MENLRPSIEHKRRNPESAEDLARMEAFYASRIEAAEGVSRITLDDLKELKEKGITTERFLDHLCERHRLLLHGSTKRIEGEVLRSSEQKIFASDRAAIAVMRSLYANDEVNLRYPYFINATIQLTLEVHVPPEGSVKTADNGFVYVVHAAGFRNDPLGSWQYIKKSEEVPFKAIIETEKDDFTYPVTIVPASQTV